MIYFFVIITIILLLMLLGGKESNSLGDNKYSSAFIASILATAAVYIWG